MLHNRNLKPLTVQVTNIGLLERLALPIDLI